MRCIPLIVALAIALPSAHAEDAAIDFADIPNLSASAQFCQLGKPKKGRFSGLEKCKEGDLLYYDKVIKADDMGHMVRICEWGSLSQSQAVAISLSGASTYVTCIYRGDEMPIRE